MKTWLVSLAKRLGALAVLVAGILGYSYYDKSANFHPVTATVSRVEQLCFLHKKQYRKTTITNDVACDVANAVHDTDPKYADFEVRPRTMVTSSYTQDGKSLTSRHEQRTNDQGMPVAAGDAIEILVSNTDPAQTRAK